MDDKEILKWIEKEFIEKCEPFEAITDHHLQKTYYWCTGCSRVFESCWPQWEKPNDETFPHEPDCDFIKAKKLLQHIITRYQNDR